MAPRSSNELLHIDLRSVGRARIRASYVKPAIRKAQRLVRTTKPLELTVVFTDRKVIRALNRRHRGINAPTDVLSFSYPPDVRTAPWAGEIVICVPQARAQAKQYGHSLLKEITLLAVHGFLHIVGFDHATQRQATRMRRLENSVLGMSGSRTES